MLGNLFNSTTMPALQQTIAFTTERHKMLAGNVANKDTPGYVAQDLSVDAFQARLKTSIDERDEPQVHSLGNRHIGTHAGMNATDDLSGILYHDESNVSMEFQMAKIAENHSLHNQAIALLRQQVTLLNAAIGERV